MYCDPAVLELGFRLDLRAINNAPVQGLKAVLKTW
jgi:hypothetical protein